MRVYSVDHPDLLPLEMPRRFKHDIAYFMTPAGEHGAPRTRLPAGEYWIRSGRSPPLARRRSADGHFAAG